MYFQWIYYENSKSRVTSIFTFCEKNKYPIYWKRFSQNHLSIASILLAAQEMVCIPKKRSNSNLEAYLGQSIQEWTKEKTDHII